MTIPTINIPLINVKTNSLDALLAGLGLRFMQLSKTSSSFKALLEGRSFTIQISSEDGIARHFKVNHGSFTQHHGYAAKPDLNMIFKDSATGVKILTKGDPTAFMVAVQAGELKMEGDYTLLMWFGNAAKFVLPQIPEKLESYVDMAKPYAAMAIPYAKQAIDMAKNAVSSLRK